MYTLDMIVKQDEKVKPGKLELEILEKYPEFLEDYKWRRENYGKK